LIKINHSHGEGHTRLPASISVFLCTFLPSCKGSELGEHNDQVLLEIGFKDSEIDALYANGVVTKTAALQPAAS
jgi:crotonobetainyl-CoA:carnitine CoA-transferase CaiB-like acyl-CoA transferase